MVAPTDGLTPAERRKVSLAEPPVTFRSSGVPEVSSTVVLASVPRVMSSEAVRADASIVVSEPATLARPLP